MVDTRTAPYAATLLRVSLGVMFIAHSVVLKYLLVPILAGATWVHAGNGWVFNAPNGGWEYPVFLISASLAQALLGDGRYALGNAFSAPNLQEVMA